MVKGTVGLSRNLERNPLAVAVGLCVLTISVCGFRLDLPDIYGDDEALDAGVVWKMAENGHWLLPSFNGENVPSKPPLFFWIASGIARLRGGVDETTVRLPSVVMAAVTVVTLFLARRHLVSPSVAFLASLITQTFVIPTQYMNSSRLRVVSEKVGGNECSCSRSTATESAVGSWFLELSAHAVMGPTKES
jgi:predicted membrane-bound mannosyltransferase